MVKLDPVENSKLFSNWKGIYYVCGRADRYTYWISKEGERGAPRLVERRKIRVLGKREKTDKDLTWMEAAEAIPDHDRVRFYDATKEIELQSKAGDSTRPRRAAATKAIEGIRRCHEVENSS